ncbi:hypothetical protein [Propionibacterium australiense]|uniref:Twin arginine translocation (Tat) signal profile n=1 Tax=Propionibacterium australiense TaxID=119981 RepID=A0A383S6J4_9ACTN|nr:hypothetical protein [Propionibacterium australiense]RLP09632.1 hypothetical protein D7U36_07525 [Propionibacterium australiense]RLP12334.1 hypothetical protein D9T14_00305 [Propionibacterium australiense]SYZ33537.1 Twin arginine translocation (Tat) signal profile [Propionibacterium australiense]VEH89619.1 Uncharacterised protein [Propionibacterium australiense]
MAALTRRVLLAGLGAGALGLSLAACADGSQARLPSQGALASVDGNTDLLDLDQAANAAIIVGEAIRRGLRARAATIALATAIQESRLYNIDYGDRDSLGLFQQRASQGWGTEEQIMDPWYSSGAFYDALVQVDGWDSGSINDVAQTVQRSGVPDGYAAHETIGRLWASALYGYDEAAVTLVDRAGSDADPDALTGFVDTVWGSAIGFAQEGSTLTFTAPDSRQGWGLAQLLMCRGSAAGLTGLRVGQATWTGSTTERAGWQGDPGSDAARVVATLRG